MRSSNCSRSLSEMFAITKLAGTAWLCSKRLGLFVGGKFSLGACSCPTEPHGADGNDVDETGSTMGVVTTCPNGLVGVGF